MDYVQLVFDHAFFKPTLYYFTTLFGAISMYVFSLNKGFSGSIDFLKAFFPNRQEVFYIRCDFIVVNIVGSIVGTIFFNPSSALEALAAGFGWVGAINILLKRND